MLEKYKKNRQSFLCGTDFTAEKDVFGIGTKSGSTHCFGNCYGTLTDISNASISFLTVSGKCKYSGVYIFHIIYAEGSTWKLIPSQMKMINIFPDLTQQLSITKIFLSNCIREKVGYLPQNSLWLNRFFCKSSQFK